MCRRDGLQRGERYLLLAAVLAGQADDGLGGAEALEGEQALVDVADLLHGQRAERDRAQLPADKNGLDRAEHVQDGPVVHGERHPQVGARVEQRPVVGDQVQLGVGHAPVDDGEQGQQPVPGQHGVVELALVAARVGDPLLELGVQAAHRVGAGVQLVVGGEQAALLGEQQEDDPHHHRDRAPVDLVRGDIGADAGPAERGDQQLDRLADLDSQPVGDLFLVVQALPQQRREAAFRRDGEEAAALEQGKEGTQHRSFGGLWPGDGVEDGHRGDAAGRRPHQGPPPAVGRQAELGAVVAAELGQPVRGGGRPVRALDPGDRGIVADQAEQPHLTGTGFDQAERGGDHALVLGHVQAEPGQVLALHGTLPAEQVIGDVRDPAVPVRGRVLLPLAVFLAEPVLVLVVQRLQVGPFGGEHGDGQERAADLDQLEPVDVRLPAVLAGDTPVPAGRAHRTASRRGTTKITATGKLCRLMSR